MDAALLLPIALVLIALILLWTSSRQRQQIQMPSGQAVYKDTDEKPGEILYSDAHHLKGRPDFLLRKDGFIIPVEAKTGRTPDYPYHGQIMQLAAYCLLVEEKYGQRPPYGIIRYPARSFQIPFTEALENELVEILVDMHRQREATDVHRQHNNPKICAACGYNAECNQRLPEQSSFLTD